jgi:hypothetical protein
MGGQLARESFEETDVTHRTHPSDASRDRDRNRARAERWRWRRHRLALVLAALPLLVIGVVTVAVAAPPGHGQTGAARRPGSPGTSASASISASASQSTDPGASASAGDGAPAADPNPNCTLTVPAAPLTARGLATPYQLSATNPRKGACHEANTAQTAFVQATIYDPATGRLSVYDPLVVDAGRRPAVTPTTPTLPSGAVVGIWFGYNADNLTLRAAANGLAQAHCVNGLGNSVFGQYAYCNAPAFFTAVNKGIAVHRVTVPALGTAADGKPCPTTRDFSIIDQDQSDNVTTQYLATAGGAIAQDTPANANRLRGATVLANPSDNALLDEFVDPALGCTPWTVRDLATGGTSTSLALDEIQANARQAAPVALVPLNDPMTTLDGVSSTAKTNAYRAGTGQAALPAGQNPKTYCQTMDSVQTARLQADRHRLTAAPSPDTGAANSLFTFMADRLHGSFVNLGCGAFHLTNPISSEQTDADGVVTAVTFARSGN